ncbi:PH domain-containing protein [Corynebacterium freneyi]|uniref:PH domain-containing protein n=1 Tax=Corynebacterium freneyi TaxID=134034 RepID=UPI00396CAA63
MTAPIGPGRHRVHPLTPLLSAGRFLAAALAVAVFNIIQQGTFPRSVADAFTDGGATAWLVVTGVAIAVVVITVILAWVSWRYRFFELADDEIRIGSGWLVRSRRSARFDRVQAVDVNQPLLARLVGLGEVKVETAGGGDSDLTIRYLGLDDCRALRSAVLEAKRETENPGGPTVQEPDVRDTNVRETNGWGTVPAPDSPVVIHGPVSPLRLLGSVAIGPGLLLLVGPPAVFGAATIVIAAFGLGNGISVGEVFAMTVGAIAGTSFVGVGVFLMGLVASMWQRWNQFHGFTLSADDQRGRLHVSAGLTSTRRQTIPVRRIHALAIIEPAWWRPLHWAKVRINVAGYAGEGANVSTTLLPVASLSEADGVVDGVIGRITGLRHQPSEARWASPKRSVWLSPIDWRNQVVRITPRALVVTSGRLRRYRAVIPWSRIQGHTLLQGPMSRALSLVDVRIDLVGGPVSVTATQLAPDDAARLMRVLDERRGA